jgi:hypothetical protein
MNSLERGLILCSEEYCSRDIFINKEIIEYIHIVVRYVAIENETPYSSNIKIQTFS